MNTLLRTGLAVVATAALAFGGGSVAHAQTTQVDLTQTGPACTAVLAPVAAGQTASKVVSYQCYSSSTGAARSDVAASNPLLGIEYKDYNYGGSTLTLYGNNGTGCAGGVTYGFSPLPSGWDNTIGSAKSYSGCQGRHWDYLNYQSSSIVCTCANMGVMNDKTSSILFQQ